MKLTLSQWNIIKELIADESDACGCDLANMQERFENHFAADDEAVKETDVYKEAVADIKHVEERYGELSRILDKLENEAM